MNVRRLNDFLKIAGALVGGAAVFGPVLAAPHASLVALIIDLIGKLPEAVALYAAGMGTRALGTEYQDVADAKAVAKASMAPPPLPQIAIAPPVITLAGDPPK